MVLLFVLFLVEKKFFCCVNLQVQNFERALDTFFRLMAKFMHEKNLVQCHQFDALGQLILRGFFDVF